MLHLSHWNSLANLDLNWKDEKTRDILTRIKSLKALVAKNWFSEEFDTEVTRILSDLKSNPQTLLDISLELQRTDPSNFESFRSSLISLDSDFRILIPSEETKAMLALGNDTLKNAKISGNSISQDSPDWYTTKANLDGTGRTLARSGDKYSVKSTLDNDEFVQRETDRISSEAKRLTEPLTNTLENLNALKRYLGSLSPQTSNIWEVKTEIKNFSPELYNELGIDSLSSVSDIQWRLDSYIAKISKQRDEIEEKAKIALNRLTVAHKEALAEKQKYQKKALDTLHPTWLTSIEQIKIDLVFESINRDYAKYWFTAELSIENASLWFDEDMWNMNISEQEEIYFYEACNRMITWTPSYPIWYENWNVIYYATAQDAENKIQANQLFNINEFVKKSLWGSPEITAQKNLDESVEEFGKIGETGTTSESDGMDEELS